MTIWTPPATVAPLEVLPESYFNTHVRDNPQHLVERDGRVRVGYYDRTAPLSLGGTPSTSDTSIIAVLPTWARPFRFFECLLTGPQAAGDFARVTIRFNTTSTTGNDGEWGAVEKWDASGGTGLGGVFSNTAGDNGTFGRVGTVQSTAHAFIERTLTGSRWSVMSQWGGRGADGASQRRGLGKAWSEWSNTAEIHTIMLRSSQSFGSSTRLLVHAVPRPGLDAPLVGEPVVALNL